MEDVRDSEQSNEDEHTGEDLHGARTTNEQEHIVNEDARRENIDDVCDSNVGEDAVQHGKPAWPSNASRT